MTPSVALVSGKAGVGTTSLAYHLAWWYAEHGRRVLAVDLDPQASLTTMMVDEERLGELWGNESDTVYGAVERRIMAAGEASTHREPVAANLEVLVGALSLATLEDELALQWVRCLDGGECAVRATMAMHHCIQRAAEAMHADLVLVDLGPTFGAINRAALLACGHLVVPVAPDLVAAQALRTLGRVVRQWRKEWGERVARVGSSAGPLPLDVMRPAGYVVVQPELRLDRAPHSPRGWMAKVPDRYTTAFLESDPPADPSSDPQCLGILKWFGSLMPMAVEARKPIFHLRPADGALGAHATAVREARRNYQEVAHGIAAAISLLPTDE